MAYRKLTLDWELHQALVGSAGGITPMEWAKFLAWLPLLEGARGLTGVTLGYIMAAGARGIRGKTISDLLGLNIDSVRIKLLILVDQGLVVTRWGSGAELVYYQRLSDAPWPPCGAEDETEGRGLWLEVAGKITANTYRIMRLTKHDPRGAIKERDKWLEGQIRSRNSSYSEDSEQQPFTEKNSDNTDVTHKRLSVLDSSDKEGGDSTLFGVDSTANGCTPEGGTHKGRNPMKSDVYVPLPSPPNGEKDKDSTRLQGTPKRPGVHIYSLITPKEETTKTEGESEGENKNKPISPAAIFAEEVLTEESSMMAKRGIDAAAKKAYLLDHPSERRHMIRWPGKDPDEWGGLDILGYWLHKYKTFYGQEDPDFCGEEFSLKRKENLFKSAFFRAKSFLTRFLPKDESDPKAFLDWLFDHYLPKADWLDEAVDFPGIFKLSKKNHWLRKFKKRQVKPNGKVKGKNNAETWHPWGYGPD